MRAIEIVKVNIFKNRQLQFIKRAIGTAVSLLKFQKFEEIFSHSVIIRMPLFGKRLNKGSSVQPLSEFIAGILRTSVRMENHIFRIIPVF